MVFYYQFPESTRNIVLTPLARLQSDVLFAHYLSYILLNSFAKRGEETCLANHRIFTL